MLKHLYIKNFIFIDELELTLDSGVIMITGETGAGKSIILGAIDTALGQKASQEKIKPGENEAEIILTFDITHNQKAKVYLEEYALNDEEPECIIRRIIYKDGKTRNFINGRPSNITTLRELGEYLLALHTQHENQLLLSTQGQMQLLDAYAGAENLLNSIGTCVTRWKKVENDIQTLTSQAGDKNQRLDYLVYQQKELQAARLNIDEINVLSEQHKALTSAHDTLQYYEAILTAFSPDNSLGILDILQRLRTPVHAAEKNSKNTVLSELLENAIVQLEELSHSASQMANKVDIDPEKLQQLEMRISELHQLARKHHVQPEELPALLEKIEYEIESLKESEKQLKTLKQEKENLEREYQTLANALTKKREKASKTLSKKITELIHQLGMSAAEFSIALHKRFLKTFSRDVRTMEGNEPEHRDVCSRERFSESAVETTSSPHINGAEQIEFLLKANAGQSAMSLKKAASGGELARVSLALQTSLAAYIQIPTLILDEIDVGVGGKIAAMIGQQLRGLGKTHQVICITHQPQIAASGHQHLKVEKIDKKQQTFITVSTLTPEERVNEIARMLGGLTITEHALTHARELLNSVNRQPPQLLHRQTRVL